ncbi:MAG: L-aminopeptidase/D-esterase [Chloroflexi bacterium]|jgi:L-aminopeptidase/D-esterase-like protein|nr:MAG: L-aminopeptidase/D-esterase [Chloroflexota bacterium]
MGSRELKGISGIKIGHVTDLRNATGCTVVLSQRGAVGGVDVRGSAPGTRETDLLRPGNLINEVHGVLLSGGSAYGLDAAAGVMKYLEEKQVGYRVGKALVPIVPAAIISDLNIGNHEVRPNALDGYRACEAARSDNLREGSIGAGTGATVGKAFGLANATKGGLGIFSHEIEPGLIILALVVVNSWGDVVDPGTGRIVAGPRDRKKAGFINTMDSMVNPESTLDSNEIGAGNNTTIGILITNAELDKSQANKLAGRGQDGIALAVRPAHTMADGDTVFTLATGRWDGETDHRLLTKIGSIAAVVMSKAIVRAVSNADGLEGIPSVKELNVES